MKEFPSEIIEIIAVGDTIIFNFPLSIFNSAAEWLPYKLKFEVPSATLVERINHRFLPQFVPNYAAIISYRSAPRICSM